MSIQRRDKTRQRRVPGGELGELTPAKGANSPMQVRVVGERTLLALEGSPDQRVAGIAGRQRGLVSRRQLLAAGLTDKMIRTRVGRGQLTWVRRGVYAIAPSDADLVPETEAILVCGPTACLSHLTAVRLWELLTRRDTPTGRGVDVTVTASARGRSHVGINLHRSGTLARGDVHLLQRLPVTSVERTLIDSGPLLKPRQFERALDEALARRLTTPKRLQFAASGHAANSVSAAPLRRLLVARDGPLTITHSEAEERLLELIRQADLPQPQLQAHLHGYTIDFYWPDARFAVEFDGYAWHTNKTNFSRDRRKDRILADRGITLTRVTWDQLQAEPLQLVAHFARRLPAAQA